MLIAESAAMMAGETAMISIAIYIGMFVWGMKTERLSPKPFGIILALVTIQMAVTFLILGGPDALRSGLISPAQLFTMFGAEWLVETIVFLIGHGIYRLRNRSQENQDNVTDTFS